MTESTRITEYRLLLWTFEEAPASNTTGSFPASTPTTLPLRPMPLMAGSGHAPQIPTRFGASWSAGLGKREVPEVGSLPYATKSGTKEWRLANASGLQLRPDSGDVPEEGDEPEFFDELLIALTRVLQTGELKNGGWCFKWCYDWDDKTTGEKSKYVRVLIEREVLSAGVSLCAQCRLPNLSPGNLSCGGLDPSEDNRNRVLSESRWLQSIGTENKTRDANRRPVSPRRSAGLLPYSDIQMHWCARSVPDPFQAEYCPPHRAPDWWSKPNPKSAAWHKPVVTQHCNVPPRDPRPSDHHSDAQPGSHRSYLETQGKYSLFVREQKRGHVPIPLNTQYHPKPAFEAEDSDDSWDDSDHVRIPGVNREARPSVHIPGAL